MAHKEISKANLTSELTLEWVDLPEEVQQGVEALNEKKVENIKVYDLRTFTPFFDFVLIGTVLSLAQSKAAIESVVDSMERAGYKLWGVEGGEESGWILIDFWDVVVHLFRPEVRRYYNLEALWADLPSWPDESSGED